MKIVSGSLSRNELTELAAGKFGFVKAVVDLGRGILAVDAELHADLEALLLQDGSKQTDLWGINLHPDAEGDALVEYDSMINIRPSQGNRSRDVQDPALRRKILDLVAKKVLS
ncbi:MAG: hypothetical protein MOGMAGMI_01462 [Candidatus Omnitrophica bacterium]|nr:hypothetical protein [Candidatus Omnitrophota bacterium]